MVKGKIDLINSTKEERDRIRIKLHCLRIAKKYSESIPGLIRHANEIYRYLMTK